MNHPSYTVIRLPGQSKRHIIPLALAPGVSLVNFDTLCQLPCGLGTRVTETGDGAEVCAKCAEAAVKRGLI